MFGKPEPTVQELVTACVVRKENSEVGFNNNHATLTEVQDIFSESLTKIGWSSFSFLFVSLLLSLRSVDHHFFTR